MKKVATTIALSTHVDETAKLAQLDDPQRALPRIVGRRARGGRHAERRAAADPATVRREGRNGGSRPARDGEGSAGPRPRRRDVKPILGRGLVREALEPGAPRRAARGSVRRRDDPRQRSTRPRRPSSRRARTDGFEVHFRPSPYLHDGRYANDGWLQELPDPVTKLTWDNPALLSPPTAKALNVADGDLVTVTVRGRSLTLPATIVPGQADEHRGSHAGLRPPRGRAHRQGVGFDAYSLRILGGPRLRRRNRRQGRRHRRPRRHARAREHGRPRAHPRGHARGVQARAGVCTRSRRGPEARVDVDRKAVQRGTPVGHDDRPRTPASAATPASSPARARTTSRSSGKDQVRRGARCTGSASTGTSPGSPSSRG